MDGCGNQDANYRVLVSIDFYWDSPPRKGWESMAEEKGEGQDHWKPGSPQFRPRSNNSALAELICAHLCWHGLLPLAVLLFFSADGSNNHLKSVQVIHKNKGNFFGNLSVD